jgi:hypothetical protein
MPTYDAEGRFWEEYDRLTLEQRQAFLIAVRKMVEDLRTGVLRASLRVKRVRGHDGIWEMTWAPDGRATFRYGPSVRPGELHVIWRRVGGHEIFVKP